MTEFSLSVLILILTAFGLFVWRARPDNATNRWFAAFTFSVACWALGIVGLQTGSHLTVWGRFTFASASMIPATFLAFLRTYPATEPWPPPLFVRLLLLTGASLGLLALTTPLIVSEVVLTPQGLARRAAALYPLFSLYSLATWAIAFSLLLSKWRRARGLPRAQLQYLGIAIAISGTGAVTTNLLVPLLTGRSDLSWIGPYFSVVLVVIVGHAIIRHRLMDLRLVVRRSVAYGIATVLASALLITLGYLLIPGWGTASFILGSDPLTVALVTLAILTSPAQRLLAHLIDPYLYRRSLDYATDLPHLTRRLSHLRQPPELAEELRQILSEALVPESFSMVAHSPDGIAPEPLAVDNPTIMRFLEAPNPVGKLVAEQPAPSVLLIVPPREQGPVRHAHDALHGAGVEVVVALGRRGQRFGTMFLGPRRSGDAYFTKDLAFIESLAELASIALENALLYRQRIQMLDYSDRLLESLNSAVIAVDGSGTVRSLNPAATSLLGLNERHLGAPLDALPAELAWALALAINKTWVPRDVELSIDHPSRGPLPVLVSTAVLHADRQRVSGALAVLTDLSTVKALERNQRRMEHLALMARFYAGIAHEIRSPLASISNFIAMLPDRFDDPEYRQVVTRLLPMELARIAGLADRLRLMAPSEDGKLRQVVVPSLLHDIAAIQKPAAARRGVNLLLACANDLPTLHADPGQLVQLFVNLLNNAIEAMPIGGDVTIEALRRNDRNRVPSVLVRVVDTGTGIDPAIRSKVLEPFFTTKPTGLGLGLSICREICDFHGATLSLYPRTPPPGTVAAVEFPAADVNRPGLQRESTPHHPGSRHPSGDEVT